MKELSLFLKIFSSISLLIGVMHFTVGLEAEIALGAQVEPSLLKGDHVLDSQSRFCGVSFTIYGILLYLCATDLYKYQTVFYCLAAVFFAGGIARLVSMFVVPGLPPLVILFFTGTELLVPPFLVIWYKIALIQR